MDPIEMQVIHHPIRTALLTGLFLLPISTGFSGWSPEQSLEKKSLIMPPILRNPNLDLPFILEVLLLKYY